LVASPETQNSSDNSGLLVSMKDKSKWNKRIKNHFFEKISKRKRS
jgi:hypothetical protein